MNAAESRSAPATDSEVDGLCRDGYGADTGRWKGHRPMSIRIG